MSSGNFKRTKRFRLIVSIAALVVILAVAIPLIIFFIVKSRRHAGHKSNVLVPLYVYPQPGAWSPLLDVIENHPHVHFDVVVNPNNGPGDTPYPDGNYTRSIPELTQYENVRVLGYVHTSYAKRNLSSILDDVATYANWPKMSPGLKVEGIFVDETPGQYNKDDAQYLDDLSDGIRATKNISSDAYIVHNPGAMPDSRYMSSANLTIVFEETYDTWNSKEAAEQISDMPSDRSTRCAVMHSIPPKLTKESFKSLVDSVEDVAGSLYLTDLDTEYYAAFSNRLDEFVSDL